MVTEVEWAGERNCDVSLEIGNQDCLPSSLGIAPRGLLTVDITPPQNLTVKRHWASFGSSSRLLSPAAFHL